MPVRTLAARGSMRRAGDTGRNRVRAGRGAELTFPVPQPSGSWRVPRPVRHRDVSSTSGTCRAPLGDHADAGPGSPFRGRGDRRAPLAAENLREVALGEAGLAASTKTAASCRLEIKVVTRAT